MQEVEWKLEHDKTQGEGGLEFWSLGGGQDESVWSRSLDEGFFVDLSQRQLGLEHASHRSMLELASGKLPHNELERSTIFIGKIR